MGMVCSINRPLLPGLSWRMRQRRIQVFTVETRHPVEVTALGSGRLLSSRSGAPAAMLMYQDAEGIRATLYLARNRGAEPSSFRFFSSAKGVLNLYTGLIAT